MHTHAVQKWSGHTLAIYTSLKNRVFNALVCIANTTWLMLAFCACGSLYMRQLSRSPTEPVSATATPQVTKEERKKKNGYF